MKKALALILAVCMLFSCAVMVSAAEGTSPAVQDSQDSGSQDSGNPQDSGIVNGGGAVSYTHLRAHETGRNLVCRLLLEKKKQNK